MEISQNLIENNTYLSKPKYTSVPVSEFEVLTITKTCYEIQWSTANKSTWYEIKKFHDDNLIIENITTIRNKQYYKDISPEVLKRIEDFDKLNKALLINKPELTDGPNIILDMIQDLKTP